MRTVSGTTLLFVAVLAFIPCRTVDSQGSSGRAKTAVDGPKGKNTKADAKSDKKAAVQREFEGILKGVRSQKTAVEQRLPVPNSRSRVFTADEAKGIQPHGEQIMGLLEQVNFRLLQ